MELKADKKPFFIIEINRYPSPNQISYQTVTKFKGRDENQLQ